MTWQWVALVLGTEAWTLAYYAVAVWKGSK
jgi:hypothetical protein